MTLLYRESHPQSCEIHIKGQKVQSDERELINELKRRNPSASQNVIRSYSKHLLKTCFGLGFSQSEAEDIVQSVWETFFDVIHNFEGRSSIRTFLFGILYNKSSEFRRQNKRFSVTENLEEIIDSHFDQNGKWVPAQTPISPDRFLESSQTLELISKCLELLPLNQKMAFLLKEIEEERSENICNNLEISVSNLGVLLFRARNQLRECIESKSR